ncbi:MAG: DUF86 domain-containing protein [bacterium]|nr:DUF86 domain-containing protein [bacterium]
MSNDEAYVRHIIEAIEKIERYLNGVPAEEFTRRDLLIDGVVRELEIIGEAARHFSQEFRSQHPDIPTQDIVGMRDHLIHQYFGVDLDIVWKTVQDDLPSLKAQLQRILGEV